MNKHAPLKFDGWPTRSQIEELDHNRATFQREYVCQPSPTPRGTGRTLALLQLLPKNAVFVVQTERMFDHVHYLCGAHGLDLPHLLVTPSCF